MITLNSFFDRVYWVGSVNRPDRAALMEEQLAHYGIVAERFEAVWKPVDHLGKPNGNMGCTASHRAVLDLIVRHGWRQALVLEDDAQFIEDTWPEQFDAMIGEVPDDWQMLFLGAGYAEDPIARVSGSVIRAGALMTTSSYGIRLEMARRMAPHISGIGPIDSLYHDWQRKFPTYIFSPRLMDQRPGYSDLCERENDSGPSMRDTAHENRFS